MSVYRGERAYLPLYALQDDGILAIVSTVQELSHYERFDEHGLSGPGTFAFDRQYRAVHVEDTTYVFGLFLDPAWTAAASKRRFHRLLAEAYSCYSDAAGDEGDEEKAVEELVRADIDVLIAKLRGCCSG